MSKVTELIFNDLMENVKIIYHADGLAYAKTDDIKTYFEELEVKRLCGNKDGE